MARGSFNRGLNTLLKYTGAGLSIAMLAALPGVAHADESGVSFWVPGFFGSLAATPQQPGWSLANIYYHTSVSAGADVARAREFTLGRVPGNLTVNANLNLNVNATGNLGFVIPTYVFATPVLGGQASVSLWQPMASSAPAWRGPCPAWSRARSATASPSRGPTASATRHGALGM